MYTPLAKVQEGEKFHAGPALIHRPWPPCKWFEETPSEAIKAYIQQNAYKVQMELETRSGERFAHGKTREATVTFIACCKCEQSQAQAITIGEHCYNSIICNLCDRPYVLVTNVLPTYTDKP